MKVGVVEVFSTVALIGGHLNQSNQYKLNITFARNSNWCMGGKPVGYFIQSVVLDLKTGLP